MFVRFFVVTLLIIWLFRSEAQGDIYLEEHRTVADSVAQYVAMVWGSGAHHSSAFY